MAVREDITQDTLMGGRVHLRQPARGYRAAIDPVLLAAAVPAGVGEDVLDVGAGVGAAALCLARRVAECRVRGIELQRELVHLATENVRLNEMGKRVEIMVGNLAHPPPRIAPGSFSHVMANPPYLDPAANDPSPHRGRRTAMMESGGGLGQWINHCVAMARPGGTITMIQRADRLDALLSLLTRRAGDVVIFPLWPFDPFDDVHAKPASRVILRAKVGSHAPAKIMGGLVLHGADGEYTDEAEAVLRHGAPLLLGPL